MKNLIIVLILVVVGFKAFSQTPAHLVPSARYLVTGAVGSDPATLTGVIQDDLSAFDATSFAIGDSIYLIDGSDLLIYSITSITTASGNTLVVVCDDVNNTGIAAPVGQGAITKATTVYNFPIFISGLRDDLRSMIMNRFAQLIEREIQSADEVARYVGNGVPANSLNTSSGYVLAQGLASPYPFYKWDGSAWQIISSSKQYAERFTATASQTAFTISITPSTQTGNEMPIIVTRNGVDLYWVAAAPNVEQFTYSGTTVTTSACAVGDAIVIKFLN